MYELSIPRTRQSITRLFIFQPIRPHTMRLLLVSSRSRGPQAYFIETKYSPRRVNTTKPEPIYEQDKSISYSAHQGCNTIKICSCTFRGLTLLVQTWCAFDPSRSGRSWSCSSGFLSVANPQYIHTLFGRSFSNTFAVLQRSESVIAKPIYKPSFTGSLRSRALTAPPHQDVEKQLWGFEFPINQTPQVDDS